MAENAEQKRLFTAALQKQCGDEDKERSQFLTERKYEEVCAVLEQFSEARDASEKKAVQKVHSQVYAWAKKYELVTFKGSKILIFKGVADGDGDTLALDQAQVVSHHGRVFEDLLKIHIDGGHCKAKTFLARIKIAHGKSIPRWAAEAFVNYCPSCVRRLPRKPNSTGHKPILTKGLGSRGQVDLIDFQSCPDSSFKFLLNYQDHGACLRARLPYVAVCKPRSRLQTDTPSLRTGLLSLQTALPLLQTAQFCPPICKLRPSAHSVCKLSPPRVQTAGIKLHDNRALTSKRNDAVAFALLDIFTVYGAPAILQSDNGREFTQVTNPNPDPNPTPNPDP